MKCIAHCQEKDCLPFSNRTLYVVWCAAFDNAASDDDAFTDMAADAAKPMLLAEMFDRSFHSRIIYTLIPV